MAVVSFGGGYYIDDDIRVDLGGAADLSDSADAYEVYARAATHHHLPFVRAFAGVRAGYYWIEARGGDYIFNDRGPRAAFDLGFRLAFARPPDASIFLEPSIALSFAVSHSTHNDRNSSYPEWTRGLALGLTLPITF